MAELNKLFGIKNIAKGTVTITAGNTTATITHNLGSVPVITLTPKSAIGTPFWSNGETTTQAIANILISLDTDITFGYEAVA